ncbi:hypothetical protein PF010_g14485 [Phytophthora fragariae]|uniref:RNB domain-containing protein n=2 Tax=Phytophthora fragariae TaxID=53985 RepID=A0A6G0KWS2_9STRA|nr:hypothetical protein PF010_g14485 [Phytophthora fragariae]
MRTLGDTGDELTETDVLLIEHDIASNQFSDEVMRCLPPEDWRITPQNSAGRRDLRRLPVLSIDPPNCCNIDDALHAKYLLTGNYEVGVHIADVTHFVCPGSALDKEAAARGISSYMVNRRCDMLPDLLTASFTSLTANKEHFAFSVLLELKLAADDVQVVGVDFCKSIIRSWVSLSYSEAQCLIDHSNAGSVLNHIESKPQRCARLQRQTLGNSVKMLSKIAGKLRRKRRKAGGSFDSDTEMRSFQDAKYPTRTDAEIAKIKSDGVRVELLNFGIEGMIFLCNKGGPDEAAMQFDPTQHTLTLNNRKLRLFDRVRVKVYAAQTTGKNYELKLDLLDEHDKDEDIKNKGWKKAEANLLAILRGKSGASGSGRSGDAGATPYLQQLRRQLSSLDSSQKPRRRSTQPPGPAAEKSAAICSAVQLALLEPLAAVQLEVSDVSCARLQYKLLGTKRYWFRSVKQEKQGKIRWEVKIYQICCRRSTVDVLLKCTWHTMPRLADEDVAIKSVGFFDTEKAAMTALDAAVKARDLTNPFTGLSTRKRELPLELVKYFQVIVVSDRFQRKTQNQRLDMIFELLLNATPNAANAQDDIDARLIFQQTQTLWPTTAFQLRGFSTVSDNVIAMPLWRSVACHFIICAKTPAQWKAGRSKQDMERSFTERFGIIQKFWRSRRYFQKWMELMELRRKDRMASHIGSIARGILTRKFIQREKRKRYHQRVLEPSAGKIQRVFRGYIVRKRLEDTRDQIEAAITLQHMWCTRSTVKTIQEKLRGFRAMLRESAAGKIQRCYLCYRARQELNFRRLTHQACFGKAALAVQAAWRSYCSRKQLKEFRFCSLIERKACSLTQAKEDREMIEFDIFDARADLKRVMKYKAKTLRRIKEMKEMRIEWERRQPVVEKELSQLTEEDLDRGWGEAFETEKHILRFSLELSVEDILAKKQQVREYEEEIENLRIELEDLERDMEECILNETMELESYRDMELHRAGSLFAEEKARRVRLQRIRWGTRNVRKHVIMRERQDLQVFAKEALAKRQVEELGVLAFEKKQFVKRKLEQAVEDAARSRAKQNEVMMEMKRDSSVLQGFNEAVQRMQAISQDLSFQYRLPKTDLREDPCSVMCSDCGRITCDCHLRNNEEAGEDGASEGPTNQRDTNNAMINARNRNRLAKRWRYQD